MIAPRIKNCWEHWKCNKTTREKCNVCRCKMGSYCWLLAGNNMTPRTEREFTSCWECSWFKKNLERLYDDGSPN